MPLIRLIVKNKIPLGLIISLNFLSLTGCSSHLAFRSSETAFYLETSSQLPPSYSELVNMPLFNERLHISPEPVFTSEDIVNVELLKADVQDKPVYLFAFELTDTAAVQLYSLTLKNPGRRMVMKVDDKPVSLEPIREPNQKGVLWMPTRLNRTDSERLVLKLRSATKFKTVN